MFYSSGKLGKINGNKKGSFAKGYTRGEINKRTSRQIVEQLNEDIYKVEFANKKVKR